MERNFSFAYHEYASAKELSVEDATLLSAAREAVSLAYAPYSKFCVGAAVLLDNGEILKGANRENAALPSGICAERNVLAMAGNLFPVAAVVAIALAYKNENGNENEESILSPCGQCRQVLAETELIGGKPIKVIMSSASGKILITNNMDILLPLGFSKNNL